MIFGEIADGILRGAVQVEPARQFIEKFICTGARNGTFGSEVFTDEAATIKRCGVRLVEPWESDMMSEMQIHTIARQMMEKHGLTAIAEAAHNAQACESKGDI